ncbi:MAG: hypothetical protein ACOX9C_02005 [Kiritimatiellia bacterium]
MNRIVKLSIAALFATTSLSFAGTNTIIASDGALNNVTVGSGDVLNVSGGSPDTRIMLTTDDAQFKIVGGLMNFSSPKTRFAASGFPLDETGANANVVIVDGGINAAGAVETQVDGSVFMSNAAITNALYFMFLNEQALTGPGASKVLCNNSLISCYNFQSYANAVNALELRDTSQIKVSQHATLWPVTALLLADNATVNVGGTFETVRGSGRNASLTASGNARIIANKGAVAGLATLGGNSSFTTQGGSFYVGLNAFADVVFQESSVLSVSTNANWYNLVHVQGNLTFRDDASAMVGGGNRSWAQFAKGSVQILDRASFSVKERICFMGVEDGTPLNVVINTTNAVKGTAMNAPFFPGYPPDHGAVGVSKPFAPVINIGITNGVIQGRYYGVSFAGENCEGQDVKTYTPYGNHNYNPVVNVKMDGGTIFAEGCNNHELWQSYPVGITIGAGFFTKTVDGETVTNSVRKGTVEMNGGTMTLKRGCFTIGGGDGEGHLIQRGGSISMTGGNTYATRHRGVMALSGGKGRYDLLGGSFSIAKSFNVGGAQMGDTNAFIHFNYNSGANTRYANSCLAERFDGEATLNVQGGTFSVTEDALTLAFGGTGTLEVGPQGVVNVGELVCTNTPQILSSTKGFATVKLTLGATNAGTVAVERKLTINPTTKLIVDASAFTPRFGTIPLITAASREGEFGSVEVVNGHGGTVEYEGANVVFKMHPATIFTVR